MNEEKTVVGEIGKFVIDVLNEAETKKSPEMIEAISKLVGSIDIFK
ncbi:hypothetical protein [Fructobacillus tropaeoli]|uniref:Uncharacterized protein n=1 Tax=Fructobacillus tropaeoli TaxID=709323 RepID=A0A3F3HIX0_9LACO|nr:hypothetical protein [Fructobacillus tropaeoli]GAP05083.1 hypothetical protein FTRO_0430030 [Fructobacillus tropaeoli]